MKRPKQERAEKGKKRNKRNKEKGTKQVPREREENQSKGSYHTVACDLLAFSYCMTNVLSSSSDLHAAPCCRVVATGLMNGWGMDKPPTDQYRQDKYRSIKPLITGAFATSKYDTNSH